MKELLKLRNWIASRTLRVFGLLGITAALDASFFQGQAGMLILSVFMRVVNAIPFVDITPEQGISFLVVIISGVAAYLRSITGVALPMRSGSVRKPNTQGNDDL